MRAKITDDNGVEHITDSVAKRLDGDGSIQAGDKGAARVNPRPGSGGYMYTRNKLNVTTKQKFEVPTGQEISDIVICVSPNAAPTAAQDNDEITLLVGVDVADDVAADAVLGTSSIPESLTTDVLFYKLEVRPGGKTTRIPINGDLLHGNIYVRASDGATGLDVWMGAQRKSV